MFRQPRIYKLNMILFSHYWFKDPQGASSKQDKLNGLISYV